MSQPYIDWELKEAVNNGTYRYEIMRVTSAEGKQSWKGFVVYKDGSDNWFESDYIDGLRMTLIQMGQQRG